MRTFIAIELDKDIKEKIALIQQQLKQTNANVKWVKPENIHLTLKFLGEVNEEQLNKTKNILQDSIKEKRSFDMVISELGAFPKLESPRVIWIGIKNGVENVLDITSILEGELSRIDFPKEKRPFSGHITIGRVRSNKNRSELIEAVNKFNKEEQKEFSQTVKSIVLFKSTLTPKGPIYEALFTAIFKNI